MKRLLSAVAVLGLAGTAFNASAVGTAAGTPVQNTATASFVIDGVPDETPSNEVEFLVDEILDVTVTPLGLQEVDSPDTDQVVAFEVTNTGNGDEPMVLDPERVGNGGDFDPADPTNPNELYIDNGDGIFDPTTDTPYDPANPPVLEDDETITVFLLSDIPAGQDSGDIGTAQLTATPQTQVDNDDPGVDGGAAAPGTVYDNDGDGGVDAVVGSTGAQAIDTEDYVVSNLDTELLKRATKVFDALSGTAVTEVIDDGTGAGDPGVQLPGDTVRYEIEFTATGDGTIDDLVLTDAFPDNTTFVNDSVVVTVDQAGTVSTPAVNEAGGDGDGVTVGTIGPGLPDAGSEGLTVDVEDLLTADPALTIDATTSPTVITITFDVTID